MKKITATGKSIEDAIKAGLEQLGVTEDQVKIEVIDEPSKGLFGLLGAKEAKVELELATDAMQKTIQFLEEVFQLMQLEVSIEQQEEEEAVILNISGSELGILIGRRGQTLDALQYLVNIVA